MSVTRDPRYPIGPFEAPGSLSKSAREGAFEQLSALPGELRAAVEGLVDDRSILRTRDGGWTARQVVHHVADSHLNAYTRCRLLLTEDNPTIRPYDERAWAELDDAANGPTEPSLQLLEALHVRWVRCLRAQPDGAFARTLQHPEAGPMTLDDCVASYAWHGRHHTAHITSLRQRFGW